MKKRRICKPNYAHHHAYVFLSGRILRHNTWIFYKNKLILLDFLGSCVIIIFTNYAVPKEVHMAKPTPGNSKVKFLRESGTLNTHPVTDALFSDSDFFDDRDLVQVKYEMLRKVRKENEPVSHAAASFGFSRPSFYKTLADFEREGIAGLLPQKRGPRGGHKLTEEVLEFVKQSCTMEKPMSTPALLDEVEKRFGIRVHRRTLEKARRRCEKKTPQTQENKEPQ
jgi:transposase